MQQLDVRRAGERPVATLHATARSNGSQKLEFLVHEQQFTELVLAGKRREAAAVLRHGMAPLGVLVDRLHAAAALLALRADAVATRLPGPARDVPGNHRTAKCRQSHSAALRGALADRLLAGVSTRVAVPSGRLDVLLQQALEHQKSQCAFHSTTSHAEGILEDHHCTANGWRSARRDER